MSLSVKRPIRDYSKSKQNSPEKSPASNASIDQMLEHRIIDEEGQVYIVLPAAEASVESDDNNQELMNLNTSNGSSENNGTDLSNYRSRNHYTRMVINGEDRDVCNEEGCTQSFKTKTSTSHKKKHTMMHLKIKSPDQSMNKPELTFDQKVELAIKLITSTHTSPSIVENKHFRSLTGLEVSQAYIKEQIHQRHNRTSCPFLH